MLSSCKRNTLNGVRNSWAISATCWRRSCCWRSSSVAIVLNDTASSASSRSGGMASGSCRAPLAKRWAATCSERKGRVTRLVITRPTISAISTASALPTTTLQRTMRRKSVSAWVRSPSCPPISTVPTVWLSTTIWLAVPSRGWGCRRCNTVLPLSKIKVPCASYTSMRRRRTRSFGPLCASRRWSACAAPGQPWRRW